MGDRQYSQPAARGAQFIWSLFRQDGARSGVLGLAAVFAGLSFATAPGLQGCFGALLGCLVAAIAFEDGRSFTIPNHLTLTAFVAGLAYQIYAAQSWFEPFTHAILRGAACGMFFWAVRIGYRAMRGHQGLGLGDVKLAIVAGVWLPWESIPLAVELASLGAILYWLVKRFSAAQFEMSTRLPFGLFFAPAIWVFWFFADHGSRLSLY